MAQLQVGSTLHYEVRQRTVFRFQIAVAQTARQRIVSEQLSFDPSLHVQDCQVGVEGNRMQQVVVEPCQLEVSYLATVELAPELDRPAEIGEAEATDLPADVLPYLNPSRYCESDLMSKFAFDEFGGLLRGFGRVEAICDWVRNHLDYTAGSTTATSTASDVLLQRTGVCRDFAHLAITLCRGVGIPARYVSGYAADLQPPDFHGFMEAYLGDNWYLFDPTHLASTRGLVRIGTGRDAADVAFATLTGNSVLSNKQVWASFVDGPPDVTEETAVSTA